MLTISANARFFLCQNPINLRKSFESLSVIIEEMFPGEILSGAFFIFLNKPCNQIKVLFWDGDGFVIWHKQLQKGKFSRKGDIEVMNRRAFFMLLEGIMPQKNRSRFYL